MLLSFYPFGFWRLAARSSLSNSCLQAPKIHASNSLIFSIPKAPLLYPSYISLMHLLCSLMFSYVSLITFTRPVHLPVSLDPSIFSCSSPVPLLFSSYASPYPLPILSLSSPYPLPILSLSSPYPLPILSL